MRPVHWPHGRAHPLWFSAPAGLRLWRPPRFGPSRRPGPVPTDARAREPPPAAGIRPAGGPAGCEQLAASGVANRDSNGRAGSGGKGAAGGTRRSQSTGGAPARRGAAPDEVRRPEGLSRSGDRAPARTALAVGTGRGRSGGPALGRGRTGRDGLRLPGQPRPSDLPGPQVPPAPDRHRWLAGPAAGPPPRAPGPVRPGPSGRVPAAAATRWSARAGEAWPVGAPAPSGTGPRATVPTPIPPRAGAGPGPAPTSSSPSGGCGPISGGAPRDRQPRDAPRPSVRRPIGRCRRPPSCPRTSPTSWPRRPARTGTTCGSGSPSGWPPASAPTSGSGTGTPPGS